MENIYPIFNQVLQKKSIQEISDILFIQKGTFHHMSKKHLQKYVDEVAFRLSKGNCEIDTIDRINSVVSCSVGKRLKWREVIE